MGKIQNGRELGRIRRFPVLRRDRFDAATFRKGDNVLETIRQKLAYAKTAGGFEVDFLPADFEGRRQLIQVAAGISSSAAFEREVHALTEARNEFPDAAALLVTETGAPHGSHTPEGIGIMPVWQRLLDG